MDAADGLLPTGVDMGPYFLDHVPNLGMDVSAFNEGKKQLPFLLGSVFIVASARTRLIFSCCSGNLKEDGMGGGLGLKTHLF